MMVIRRQNMKTKRLKLLFLFIMLWLALLSIGKLSIATQNEVIKAEIHLSENKLAIGESVAANWTITGGVNPESQRLKWVYQSDGLNKNEYAEESFGTIESSIFKTD